MVVPCHHPPPFKPTPSSSSSNDPYRTLGLDRDASPVQIKMAYRKLALRYHPDRQQTTAAASSSSSSSSFHKEEDEGGEQAATHKFAEVATAYATLSDPARKKEYDHLYKYGAFDEDDDRNVSPAPANNGRTNGVPTNNNYRYAEDFSGGYYRPGYKPPAGGGTTTNHSAAASPFRQQQQHSAAAFAGAAAAFQSMQSQDSFFDDLIYSPRSRQDRPSPFSDSSDNNGNEGGAHHATAAASAANANDGGTGDDTPTMDAAPRPQQQHKKQPGIGFSFAPLGKHLSVHVPSRNEIVMSAMQQSRSGGGTHGGCNGNRARRSSSLLFGTRVTFSQQTTSGLNKLERIANCGGGGLASSNGGDDDDGSSSPYDKGKIRVVSTTTTRIAKGRQRSVKRTARLRPDGTREVVIEEGGVVRRRYVEENPNNTSAARCSGSNDSGDGRDDKETATGHREKGERGVTEGVIGHVRFVGVVQELHCAVRLPRRLKW
eukprot:CAMPEP_0181134746 /NCGR_PEP_ID=MMETSP1071-20121207/32254_1 /TAXON_ID=35127 /ORGANISM="Thalassiosira sp., Strain NH16" /LENGTH=486 /DNA_ID=CAMNT_0023221289 /DNA_START=464 /DNA_END=1921 /DNA_ORIENTATION=+